jgi:hypothetical protein
VPIGLVTAASPARLDLTAASPARLDPGAVLAQRVAVHRPHAATYLRCGGCGAANAFTQSERRYGQLVHDFLDQHGDCGGAVAISAAQQPAGPEMR